MTFRIAGILVDGLPLLAVFTGASPRARAGGRAGSRSPAHATSGGSGLYLAGCTTDGLRGRTVRVGLDLDVYVGPGELPTAQDYGALATAPRARLDAARAASIPTCLDRRRRTRRHAHPDLTTPDRLPWTPIVEGATPFRPAAVAARSNSSTNWRAVRHPVLSHSWTNGESHRLRAMRGAGAMAPAALAAIDRFPNA